MDDTATLVEDAAATAIDVLANDTDPDGGPKTITAKTNGSGGTVDITGGGSGLTYTPAANFCGSDSFTYTLNGGSTGTVDVTVTCVDDPPTAVNDSATVDEDSGASAIDVLTNDTDPDGGTMAITAKTDGLNGTVVITGGGTGLTYQPTANFCGADNFTYTLNGGSSATVSVTVTCVDDPPVAVNDTATVGEDAGATAIDVLANDTDIDGGPKTITATTDGSNGATVAINGSGVGLTYTPAANFCGSDSFTYTLNGGSVGTVSVTVTCVDDPPTAVDDTATVTEDSGATAIDVLANDTDIDGGPKSIASATNGANGATVVVTGGGTGLTYQPAANFCGPDSFTYTLNGGSVGTVDVTVTCVDDPPTAVNDTATVLEDGGATAIDVLANDTDPDGGTKSITAASNGTNGTVAITGGGSGLTYAPAANFCGSDSFTYTLNGGSSATVAVTVTCVNDAPSFTKGPNQTNLANQNADGSARAYTINPWATGISAGPPNEGGQTVDFVINSVTPSNLFTVQPAVSATGVLTFTTNPATSGTATITLHIHDNGGTANGGIDSSPTQSFTIQTVQPPPVAVNDSYTATGNVGINVTDTAEAVLQRGTDDTLFGATITNCGPTNTTGTAVSGGTCTAASASGGNVVLNTNGTFTYNPPVGFTGTDHFFYRLTNSGGTSTGDVSITVSNMIWFVNNGAAACTALANNCGRLANPFSTLAAFQAVNSGAAPNAQDNQTIFLYTGTGTYTNGVTLRNGQILIGQGAGASITTISGITLAPFSNTLPSTGGTRPSLTTTTAATNAITLGSGNTIRGLNIGDKTGTGIAGTNFGTLAVLEVDITGTGQALNLNNGTANATFGTLTSSSGTNGIALTAVAGATTATGGSLTGSTGDELLISAGAGSLTYPGAITKTGTGRAVNITGKSGGTVALSGQITDTGGTGGGINLDNNPGATINLIGGVSLSTGANAAFTATRGGTVTVTGSANTLTTTSGTALNVSDTGIGSSGLTFRSISAGTAGGGPANGIVLSNTGTSAGLTLQGTGAADSGGVIQNTTSHAVSLTNTRNVDLQWLRIAGADHAGVKGTGVTNFSYRNGTLTGVGDARTTDDDAAFAFNTLGANNVNGQFTITGNTVTNPYGGGVQIRNASGTITAADISSNTFQSTTDPATSKQDGVSLIIEGTTTSAAALTKATISNNAIRNFPSGSGVELTGSQITSTSAPRVTFGQPGSAVNKIVVSGNEIRGDPTTKLGVFGVAASVTGMADGNVEVTNNGTAALPMANMLGEGIGVGASGTADADFLISGNFISANNILGNVGISANANRRDVGGTIVATPSVDATISGNTVSNTSGAGIKVLHFNSNGNLRAKILNNTVSAPAQPNPGIAVENGSSNDPTFNPTLCAQISGNPATGSGPDGFGNTFAGIDLIERSGSSNTTYKLQIVGLTPTPATPAQTETYLATQNPSSSVGGGFYAGKRATVSEGNTFEACTIP